MTYKMPDPKVRPDICLVLSYKTLKGTAHDDRDWDRIHMGRCIKAAQSILNTCGSIRVADSCLLEISQKFDAEGLSWTLETIVKHAHEWVNKKRGTDGNTHRRRFFEALAHRNGSELSAPTESETGKILNHSRSIPPPQERLKENVD